MCLPPDTRAPNQQMFDEALGTAPARAGTPLPFGRQGSGWEVACATLFLISNESSYVKAHALLVDGGLAGGIARATR